MMKNEMKTNNKTVLLAILAVFAMIAAGAAVVMAAGSDVEATNAADPKDTDETGAAVTKIAWAATIPASSVAADGSYYLDMSSATGNTVLNVTADKTVTLYVKPNAAYSLTIQATNSGAADTLTIYVAKSISAADKVTYYTGLTATMTTHDGADSIVAKYSYSDVTGPVASEVAVDGFTGLAVTSGAAVNATTNTYYSKGATFSATVGTAGDVVTILNVTKATVNSTLANYTGKIVFDDVLTGTAYTLTVAAGSDLKLAGGADNVKGAITVTEGKIAGQAGLTDNATTSVFNCVANAAIGANIMAPSMTEANDDYTFAYGTANLKYSFSEAAAEDTTLTLVNSTATITAALNETTNESSIGAAIETNNISGTIVAVSDTVATKLVFVSLTLNAEAAGAGAASVKVGATDGVLILRGVTIASTIAYDLTVEKDGSVSTEATDISGKIFVKADGALALYENVEITNDVEIRGTLYIDDGVSAIVTNKAVSLYGTLEGGIVGIIDSELVIDADEGKKASFKAYGGSSISNNVTVSKGLSGGTITIDTSGAMSTAYLKGTVSSSQTFSQSQNVVVDGDLEIVNNAEITILGGFTVEEGVTMTITKGSVSVDSDSAGVNIAGAVVVEEYGELFVVDALSVNITGTIVNDGIASFNTEDAKIKQGGSVTSTEEGALVIDEITVEKGGILQIEGGVAALGVATTITNKGTVVLKGADLTANDVTVSMVAEGAVVDVQSMMRSDADDFELVINDDSYKAPTGTTKSASSQITIGPAHFALIGVGGFTVTETASTVTVGTDKFFYPGMTVDGSAAVIVDSSYAGIADNKKATIALSEGATADANVKFADGFIVGAGVTLDVDCALTVDGKMAFVGAAAPLQAVLDITGGVLTVTGTVVYDKNMTETGFANGTLNAVKLEIGAVADPIKYLTSLDNAVEIIEGSTDSITMTLVGNSFAVSKSVTVPGNVKLAGDATVTIGSDNDNTVVLTIEDGATVAAGLKINVKGSLYAENYKDLKTTSITADVKTTDGTEVLYTNLYSAVEGAETGDIVEVTNDITITKSFTIKAGVIMNIPGGFTATVNPANKVTITVNGVLCTDSTIAVTGGEWADDGVATATKAVLAVNGTFMTGESADTTGAAVNAIYHIPGAYYYLSDEIGSFVYVGSLADALLTSVKNVYIYETVYEYNAVTVGSGKTVNVANGAVLNATDISLLKSKIVTAGTGALNATVTAAAGADGTAVLSVAKYTGNIEDAYSETEKVYSVEIDEIVGTITIASGIVDVTADATAADSILTVMSGAYLYVPAGETLTFSNGYQNIFGTVFVDGTLALDNAEKLAIDGEIDINHDADALTDGKLTVSKQIALTSGSIVIADDVPTANVNFNANVILGNEPDSVGATAGVYGKVRLADNAVIIAYPDGNVEDLLINPDLEGADHSKATAFMINDVAYMIVFGTEASTVTYAQVLAIPEFDLPAYADDFTDATTWGLTAAGTVGSKLVGEADVVATPVQITISVVTGLQVFVDGVKYNSGATPLLTIGTHTVQVMVSPGYKMADGTSPSVTFAGKAVTGIMAITVTSDMVNPVLSVMGDVVVDQPDYPEQEKEDNSMIMILLAVLVVMVVILAIVTVIRMMRS